mgnify:CR=1 FL=1
MPQGHTKPCGRFDFARLLTLLAHADSGQQRADADAGSANEVREAVEAAWDELESTRAEMQKQGEEVIKYLNENGKQFHA